MGISATGRRRRRALAVSSRPISKPLRAVDADLADEVGGVGLEAVGRVAGADPGEACRATVRRPARARPLSSGPPTCWPPGGCSATRRRPRRRARPAGPAASICRGSSQPSAIVTTTTSALAWSMPKRIALAGPAAVGVDERGAAAARAAAYSSTHGHRRVVLGSRRRRAPRTSDSTASKIRSRHGHDRVALVVGRDDDRDAAAASYGVPRCPSRFQTSTTGLSVDSVAVRRVRGADDEQVGRARAPRRAAAGSSSTVTYGSVQSTSPRPEREDALELVGQARADVVALALERHAEDADGQVGQVVASSPCGATR